MMSRLMMLVSVGVVLMGVSVAQAAAAPLATTNAATAVTATDATANGSLDANGGGTTVDCHFDYVDDATFQSTAFDAPNQVGCNEGSTFDDGVQAVTGNVGGLVPNTLYHVRLVVSNATDTTNAVEQTLTTAAAPPALEGSGTSASSITVSGVTLTSSVNPNNADSTYHFEYGATTAYGQDAPVPDGSLAAAFGDQPVSALITGLTAATTYHYRITADNGTGGVQQGADHTFSTAPAGGGGASDIAASTATLTATVNPHASPASYHLEYGTDLTYGTSTAETSAGAGTTDLPVSAVVTGLRPATTYHVRAVMTDTGSGVTTTGADGTFTTAPAPVPVAMAPTAVSTDHATLNGTIDTHGLAGSYRFSVTSTTSAYATTTPDQELAAGPGVRPVLAVVADLPPGGTYRVRLSVSSNGVSLASDEIIFSSAPLPVFVPSNPGAPLAAVSGNAYGCVAPVIDAYDPHPKAGTAITITGSDLGVGGTVALGTASVALTGWTASGFTLTLPGDATGALPLTVNCGAVSNTIAIQVYQPPSNAFTATAKGKGSSVTAALKVPGPGSLSITGASIKKATRHTTKAGSVTLRARLTSKAITSLRRHHVLTVVLAVRFTPTGGLTATKTVKVTFKESK
jgi:hypothetical protein